MKKDSKFDFKQMLKDAKLGGLIGIGIALTFMFANEPSLFKYPSISVTYIVMGFIVGALITSANIIVSTIFKKIYPKFNHILWMQLVISYLINSSMYYGVFSVISLALPRVFTPEFVLITSLEVGLISLMVTMFFIYKEEKEEKLKLERENRELAVVEERNRIARELHDSVAQNLFGINLNLNTLKIIMEQDPEKAKSIVTQLQEMVTEIQTEMRLMIYELRPAALREKGFAEAVDGLVSLFRIRYNLDIRLQISGSDAIISSQIQQLLYRILQESLNNVVKHAQAGKVIISLTIGSQQAELVVKDNGKGFDLKGINLEGHFGIHSMKERVAQMNGRFEIKSAPHEGTIVTVKI
jgi:signal transduction histidine kinase